MPKTFYTERDIEDLASRGVISLAVDDDIVLTDLARDKAMRLGIELLSEHDLPPSAPERPYIAKIVSPSAAANPRQVDTRQAGAAMKVPTTSSVPRNDELYQRVHTAVLAQLGDSVEPQLLETIIRRVIQSVGAK